MMNRILSIGGAVLGALALIVVLVSGPDEQPPPPPPPTTQPSAELSALERRLDILEQTTSLLARRLTAMEYGRSDGGGPAMALPAPAEGEAPPDTSGTTASGEPIRPLPNNQQLREALRSLRMEDRQLRRQAIAQRFLENTTQGSAERVSQWRQFATDMKLNYSQERELMQRVEAEEALRKSLADQVRAGGKDAREAQREVRQARQANDEALSKVLDATQKAKFEEMRRAESRSSFRPGMGLPGFPPPGAP